MSRKTENKGLVIVYTGSGKGKTTAAIGMAVRAAGYNQKSIIIQFIKGTWKSGEGQSLKKLYPQIEIIPAGKGFVKILNDREPFKNHLQAAQAALKLARQAVRSHKYQIVVLDEINYAVKGNLVLVKDVLDLIKMKLPSIHLVLTGNYASPRLIQKADLVTEMKEIKHPFQKGIKAQEGIDY
ncbi:MAG: cob(I)yrinic acid a,c-diamide adenosyltransferase [Candidatus Kerfeldbacteria bacterium CG08_land_8_20_14_0_20_40_16]|uniref:Cob(I)yrinic acid a,c-diamide adenosyltransferase n=1 Tax=Candidatus Kerfeldbacteria bacterium CG08_land_8_20_14_0_20_40_16 TaxID=2014244 RepID=A0A2H0YV37_9BACT|nr:MAG: cob(I)yrinic acid a,c-diamide adenosyltransferase [Candidatus Kerfeldbacteria bacterium CG08_land_8_20_14_0_20_40_16]